MAELRVRRNYKDSLFRTIFQEKKELLTLYNALNRTDYEDPDRLEIHTLEDTIYMGMKNDVSFLISDELNLYEHQSSWNPNMPLRGLFYFSRLYQAYVTAQDLDIFSRTRLKLPAPRYVVFYNGEDQAADSWELKLSDSYIQKNGDSEALECIATVININVGQNEEILKQCRKLYEYACLVAEIRKGLSAGVSLETAVDEAIQACIEADILKEFLLVHRSEVRGVLLTEYRREHHIQCEKKLSFEEGCQVGRQEGLQVGRQEGLQEGRQEGLQEGHQEGRQEGIRALVQSLREVGCTSAVIGEKLREKFALDETEIRRYLEEC